MARLTRASALAALGVLSTGALTLGIAAPAQAVDTAPLSSYMLTVPPSVYSASAGYTAAEQAMWRETVRAGVDPAPPKVPVSGAAAWGILGGVQALWLGGQFIVENAGTFGTVFGVSPDQLNDRYADQGLTATEGWQCESLAGDWLGDLVTGFNDWFQSLWGVDCAALRDGELDRNPEWEPLAVEDPGFGGYPGVVVGKNSTGGGVTTWTAHQPFWSEQMALFEDASEGSLTRKEGWVLPLSVDGGTYGVRLEAATINPDGTTGTPGGLSSPLTIATLKSPIYVSASTDAQCLGASNVCVVLSKLDTADTAVGRPSTLTRMRGGGVSGNTEIALSALPYVDVLSGSYGGAGGPVVFLTTVETQDGNTYQCRTRPFLETDVDVPSPCEPSIPAGEWMTTRTVEMIPANATDWVVGSDPRRVMTDQESPQEYRDWKTAFPECSGTVCKMDLKKNGVGSCFQLGDACDGWASDPNRASNYTCTYNGQTIALSECEAGYPNVFNQTNRDLGQAYPQPTDPATGQPSTGGQTSTVAGPVTQPGAWPASPEQPRNCFPTGWNAFNPFEWIFKPVKCALEWAFVPRQSYIDNVLGNIRLVWTGSSLVSLLGVLEDGADLFLGESGCAGPTINLDVYGSHYSGNPLSACADPMASAAQFSFIFTGVAAWVMAVASIARSVAGVVQFKGIGGDSA